MGTGIHVCFDLATFQLGNKVVHEEWFYGSGLGQEAVLLALRKAQTERL